MKLKSFMENGKKLYIALAIHLIYRTTLNPSLHKVRNDFSILHLLHVL